jgi:hypothetical protein
MKKTLYTIAFIALFTTLSNAQDHSPATKKQEPARVETATPIKASDPAVTPAATDNAGVNNQREVSSSETKPAANGPKRMAITEKGVPAPKKNNEVKKAEPAKTEKH